jgi:hypothetical protein
LCKQRIVTPIPIDIVPLAAGRLIVRVAPEAWFDHVDFSALDGALGQGEELEIPDQTQGQPAVSLYQGLRSLAAYDIDWEN